jgi:hypothetical protein
MQTLCQFLDHNFFILIDNLFLLKPQARAQNFDPKTTSLISNFQSSGLMSFFKLKKDLPCYVRFLRYKTHGFCPKKFWSRGLHLSGKLALCSRIEMRPHLPFLITSFLAKQPLNYVL